ncbi:MAG TPA: AURKAIP1/COX24 domain-containing protein [Syntrophorhabdaceae bacterium]|nr:AURKAIP1/COX24 domain-containing protein [Syntrophorhabdaceae bacterium]HOJ42772.1 AURKAIP1/COX24 domain-containing protein [Syntrophorhabdaceae bacterium]HOP85598.1 AURKAIP1/COX24 domain-containing protein [Syntrophorhabdaceae bacterium]
MGSVLKWRRKKIRKHKYKKLRRRTRHQRRK